MDALHNHCVRMPANLICTTDCFSVPCLKYSLSVVCLNHQLLSAVLFAVYQCASLCNLTNTALYTGCPHKNWPIRLLLFTQWLTSESKILVGLVVSHVIYICHVCWSLKIYLYLQLYCHLCWWLWHISKIIICIPTDTRKCGTSYRENIVLNKMLILIVGFCLIEVYMQVTEHQCHW